MLLLYFLVLLCPAFIAANTVESAFLLFPAEDGITYVINLHQPELTALELEAISANVDTIGFTLYTQTSLDGETLVINDIESVRRSQWDSSRPTRFITHGWRGQGKTESCTIIRDAYLENFDYNVIVIDWGKIAGSYRYDKVAKSVPTVAQHVANFINFLKKEAGLDLSTTKMIGHSLGAHTVGIAARKVHGAIAEVIALDPAKPYFEGNPPGERIDATDAKNVQIIHTNAGRLGMQKPVGTSDFYPNGGQKQAGCSSFDVVGACSHSRSFYYYAESIRNPTGFIGSGKDNPYQQAYMGGPNLDPNARGHYTLTTNGEPPYARGY